MAHIFSHPIAGFGVVADTAKAGFVANTKYLPTAGRFGGGAFVGDLSTQSVVKSFTAAGGSRVIVQFSLKMVELGFDTVICELRNNAGADLCLDARVNTRGQLEFFTTDGDFIARTPSGTINWNTWHSIAIEAEIGNAAGALKVYVDGVLYINVDNVDLNDGDTGGCDEVRWVLSPGGSRVWHLCQIFIYDDSGGEGLFRTFIGDKQIYSLLPASDESPIEWSRSAGGPPNSGFVDDPLSAVSDEDGTYVHITPPTDFEDFYEFDDLPVGADDIIGVLTIMEYRKSDAGALTGTLEMQLRDPSEASVTMRAVTAPTESYVEDQGMFNDVPGGTGWTVNDVNDVTGGPRFDSP